MIARRGLHVGILVAATAAAIGLISGVESSGREVQSYLPAPPLAVSTTGSRSYADMRQRSYGANAALAPLWWQALRAAPAEISVRPPPSLAERRAALAQRAERRAYDGAPPLIPHAIDQLAVPACLACHERGVAIAGVAAPRMSHEVHASCVQCHVAARDLRPAPVVVGGSVGGLAAVAAVGAAGTAGVLGALGAAGPGAAGVSPAPENAFVGLVAPTGGERAWPGAPPMIPHSTWMRERCDSCHGTRGAFGLRTPHPWRQSCTQCHAPSAALDQRAPLSFAPAAAGAPGASP